jgi:hypothetical protein
METNCKKVAEEILNTIAVSDAYVAVDNLDAAVVVHSPDKCSFTMHTYVDAKTGPGRRDIKPLGLLVYTVTIEAKYMLLDDDGDNSEG